jgi:hypothetical protein
MNDPTHVAAADQQVLITRVFEAPREQVFRLRQLVHGRLALGEPGQDRAPRRIGESGKGEAEVVSWHLTLQLINTSIKYRRTAERNSGLVTAIRVAGLRGPFRASLG